MQKKPLGQSGLAVTPICFGTAALGDMPDTYGYSVSEEQARSTVRAIFDSPVNFLDTSRNYGFGRSEQRIGAVIRERGGLPDGFVLSTKLDRDMATGRFDAARARQSLEESLEALGLDSIPLLHLHDPEHARDLTEITAEGGALDALFQMKAEGLARAVGLAMGRVDVMFPLVKDWPFDAIITHNRFSLLNRSAEPMIQWCANRGIAVLNAAPYAGGILAKGSDQSSRITYQLADDTALEPVRRIEQACRRQGVATGAAALQFSLRDPRVTSTLCGVSHPKYLAETLTWASADCPEALFSELAALGFSTEDPEANRDYRPG